MEALGHGVRLDGVGGCVTCSWLKLQTGLEPGSILQGRDPTFDACAGSVGRGLGSFEIILLFPALQCKQFFGALAFDSLERSE